MGNVGQYTKKGDVNDGLACKISSKIFGASTVLLEVIRAVDPDQVEARFLDFRLRNIQYDALTVSGDLTIEDFTAERLSAWCVHT